MAHEIISLFIISYLIGSIPFGLVISKLIAKKDIRQLGSGNIGATNIVRNLGKKLGALTFILDALKGGLMLILAQNWTNDPILINAIGAIAVIGHIFPVWLKFKGGKGVATFLGVLFFYDPIVTILFLFSWYITFYITRIVSLSSIILNLAIFLFFIIQFNSSIMVFILLSVIVIAKHNENIKRILAGKEASFSKK